MVEVARSQRNAPSLVDLLDERHEVYRGCGARAVERMRASVLASFAQTGLPDDALPFVLEELDTGLEAYSVAAAAHALLARPELLAMLRHRIEAARHRIRSRNDLVSFDDYGAPPSGSRTALDYLDAALQVAGPTDCCAPAVRCRVVHPEPRRPLNLRGLIAEGSDGERFSLHTFALGRPVLVGFFYTRCDNPNKCSVTIERLGLVAQALQKENASAAVLAVTYDPSFDTPRRLHAYTSARGFPESSDARAARLTEGFDQLRESLGLGVGFAGLLPNRHRVEAYALDRQGRVAFTYSRGELDTEQILADLRSLEAEDSRKVRPSILSNLAGLIVQGAIAAMPRCPMCWGAYLSLLGMSDLGLGNYFGWIAPVLLIGAAANVFFSWRRARAVRDRAGFALTVLGTLVVVVASVGLELQSLAVSGVVISAVGALRTSFVRYRFSQAGWLEVPVIQAPGG